MERQIDQGLSEIRAKIDFMGRQVQESLERALSGLFENRPERFKEVHEIEKKINQVHLEIDRMCFEILARQAPLAGNLRFILGALKINSDLERMGDQAKNIAFNAREYLESPRPELPRKLHQIAADAQAMVAGCLRAFLNSDSKEARSVIALDQGVDDLKNEIFHELAKTISGDPSVVERAVNLIIIARNLERLGDHATNVCEDVIFILSGKDIRHGSKG